MRKTIYVFICILLVLSLVGCSAAECTHSESADGEIAFGDAPEEKQNEQIGEYSVKISYANWTEDNNMYSECLNQGKMVLSSAQHLPVFMFETKGELDHFKALFQNIMTFDQCYNEVPSFNEVTAGYDESFFTENTLVVAYVTASSGSFRYDVKNISLVDSDLCVDVAKVKDPEVYTADMAGWLVIVELNKEVVKRCASFDAKIVPGEAYFQAEKLPGFIEFGSFSWKEVERAMDDLDDMSKERVRFDCFVNSEAEDKFIPIERAKNELTKEYRYSQYFRDEEEDMWMFRFFDSEEVGPEEVVYMDGNGITRLIIYADSTYYG